MLRSAILACVAVVFGGDLGEEPPKLTARDVGFSGWGAVPEKKRVMLREKAGWKWDFPNEPPEYRAPAAEAHVARGQFRWLLAQVTAENDGDAGENQTSHRSTRGSEKGRIRSAPTLEDELLECPH